METSKVEIKEFAAYNYKTGSNIKSWLVAVAILSTIFAIIVGANFSPWGFFLFVLPAAISFHVWRAEYDKTLMISNRYLVLGEEIIYFRNVSVARLNRAAETLSIYFGKGGSLVVSASNFPTNARKPEKIKINRSNKFNKVADRVVARLKDKGVEVVVS